MGDVCLLFHDQLLRPSYGANLVECLPYVYVVVFQYPRVSEGSVIITSQTEVSNILSSSFALICSSNRYDPVFKTVAEKGEILFLNSIYRSSKFYMTLFLTVDERFDAIENFLQHFTEP